MQKNIQNEKTHSIDLPRQINAEMKKYIGGVLSRAWVDDHPIYI